MSRFADDGAPEQPSPDSLGVLDYEAEYARGLEPEPTYLDEDYPDGVDYAEFRFSPYPWEGAG